tara:strand:+ start:781 stop:1707 length:927 start_codon:yes stop_codon:yes gene_type:complete
MNKELNILLKKILYLIFPIIAWVIIAISVDPFNYFNISTIISKKSKEKSALKLNSLLYNSIYFYNNPTDNIIIGDSRIRKLPTDRIKELTGDDYFILHSNAAKLNEMIDLFWFTTEYTNPKNIILGLNFNLFNQFSYSNRVADVLEIIKNPLIYIFNYNTVETIYLCLKIEYLAIQEKKIKNKNIFWQKTINNVAKNHYSRWKFPLKSLLRLQKIGEYCKSNDINLTFLIVPHHLEFHKRLSYFDLEKEEIQFKQELKKISTVIDFDYPNPITECKECFSDPIHANDSISRLIIDEIFSDSLEIGKLL